MSTPTEPKAVTVLRGLLDSDNELVRLRAASELLRWERAEEPDDAPASTGRVTHLPDLPEGWDE
jgi:hypothetical protein